MSEERNYPQNWIIPVKVIDYEKTISDLRASLAEKDKALMQEAMKYGQALFELDEQDKEIERLKEELQEQTNKANDCLVNMDMAIDDYGKAQIELAEKDKEIERLIKQCITCTNSGNLLLRGKAEAELTALLDRMKWIEYRGKIRRAIE